jgi:two-component system, OmpR family, osmolarity sensor histidine kinase EnvZ
MASSFSKSLVPRSFYGRAVLILVIPIVVIQIVLSVVFIQRHYERVTQQLTQNTLQVLQLALHDIAKAPSVDLGLQEMGAVLGAMDIQLAPQDLPVPTDVARDWVDLAGREVALVLQTELPGYLGADLIAVPGRLRVWIDTPHGILQIVMPRSLVSATNPHQLLVIVFLASVLMAGIAFQFLRLQVRPIRRLGEAAEAYGRGESVPLRSSGAREIRAAALAFIDMRNRIERQNAQRKVMLSGVSHDMRTPLTRMRLILSMMDPDDDTEALRTEVQDLERLLNSFLDYSRGQGAPNKRQVDLAALAQHQCARFGTGRVQFEPAVPLIAHLDAALIERAMDNLISNALRHGQNVRVSLKRDDDAPLLVVEDDGPGIPARDRARAQDPFVRLDDARNQDQGSGVGLGLAIVAEIARAHDGTLTLDDSPSLGGLRATLSLPAYNP